MSDTILINDVSINGNDELKYISDLTKTLQDNTINALGTDASSRTIWINGQPYGNAYVNKASATTIEAPIGAEIFNDFANNVASGTYSHAEGSFTTALGTCSHAEGFGTEATGHISHTEGNNTTASGDRSHAEGFWTTASGENSHAEGSSSTKANIEENDDATSIKQKWTDSQTKFSLAYGSGSHVEGKDNLALGAYSHAGGEYTIASGRSSHAEGDHTEASRSNAHAEGYFTTASGTSAHAEGSWTTASGEYSHAEGWGTTAAGNESHASGFYTQTTNNAEAAFGKYNKSTKNSTIFSIGDGDSDDSRHNIVEVTGNGVNINNTLNVEDNLKVDGATILNGTITLGNAEGDAIIVNGGINFKADVDIDKVLNVDGNTTLQGTLGVTGKTTVSSLESTGNVDLESLDVTNNTTIGGTLEVTGKTTVSSLESTENVDLESLDVTNNTTIGGTLGVTGAAHFENKPTVTNGTTANDPVVLDSELNSTKESLETKISNEATNRANADTALYSNIVIIPGTGNGSGKMKLGGNSATGDYSLAHGELTIASGYGSHAEGSNTTASGEHSHAEGSSSNRVNIEENDNPTSIKQKWTDTQTKFSLAYGDSSHVEGINTLATGGGSHTEGINTLATGSGSHAEGYITTASGIASHAEGDRTKAEGDYSHAEGWKTLAFGHHSHAEGDFVSTFGDGSHAEGFSSNIPDLNRNDTSDIIKPKWVDGKFSLTYGVSSHVEGEDNLAIGDCSHAEGQYTCAEGDYSHAEGQRTIASGEGSHAEGFSSTKVNLGTNYSANDVLQKRDKTAFSLAFGEGSHVEGKDSLALGHYSHAEGMSTQARGNWSHAEGYGTITYNEYQHVEGRYNYSSNGMKIIGCGSAEALRANAIDIKRTGEIYIKGIGGYEGQDTEGHQDLATILSGISRRKDEYTETIVIGARNKGIHTELWGNMEMDGTLYVNTIVPVDENTPIKIGNTSESKYDLDISGNAYATAFYESSDATKKDIVSDIDIDFNKLRQIPKVNFNWKDDPEKKNNIGTIAQEISKIYPEVVSGEEGNMTVDYAKLSIIALAAIDRLEDRIKQLEDKLSTFEK